MDVTASVDTPASPTELFAWVDDLARYPEWLEIVPRAVAVDADEAGPAWSVDLRGRLGPLARSKRLRMVRTELHRPTDAGADAATHRVVFERREVDGRRRSPWVLTAEVRDRGAAGSSLDMHLHYGGRMWGRPLEALLADEIERSRQRLLALVS